MNYDELGDAVVDISFEFDNVKIVAERVDMTKFRVDEFSEKCWDVVAVVKGVKRKQREQTQSET